MRILNFGSLNIDFTFVVENFVKPGQTMDSLSARRTPGGKGLNQSIALARAGAAVCHAGMIGEDGLFLKALLEKNGVDCTFVETVPCDTGKAFIQVDASGQNCIVLYGGANRQNTPEFCDRVLEAFQPGDLLLLQNEINLPDLLMEKAFRRKLRIVLNPSPMNGQVLGCDLSRVSLFLLNEEEGTALTGKTEAEDILREMQIRYPGSEVILTLGSRGAVYAAGGRRIFQKSYPVKAVDTTGAGDTFTGYVLAGLAEGRPMEECLDRAARASAIAVTRPGAADAIPAAWEIDK